MAFMGIMVAGVVLVILLIGLFNLVVGGILTLIWIIRAACKKKTHILLKIPAILFLIGGFFMFVVPLALGGTLGALGQAESANRYNSIENKIMVSDNAWKEEGFDYNGKHLVPIDGLTAGIKNSETNKVEPAGAMVYSDNTYYRFYEIENDGGFHIYSFEKLSCDDFCYEEEYDAIFDYYYNKADYEMKVCHYDDENRLIGDDCEFDRKTLFEIAAYYEKGEPDYEASLDDVDVDYYIQAKSKDGCFYQAINISEIGDTMILEKGIYDRTQTGFVLSKEHADYVRSVVAKYTDLY